MLRAPRRHEVKEALASAGVTMDDAVMAQTLALKINEVERIDRLIMNAEARRNVVLHEIDRHRASLGQRLRRAIGERIRTALEVAGVEFIDENGGGPGVRLRHSKKAP
jgi:hypothetical protein